MKLFCVLFLIYCVTATPGVTRVDNVKGNVTESVKKGSPGNITSPSNEEPVEAASDSGNSFNSLDVPFSSDNEPPSQFSGSIGTGSGRTPDYALPPTPADYKAISPPVRAYQGSPPTVTQFAYNSGFPSGQSGYDLPPPPPPAPLPPPPVPLPPPPPILPPGMGGTMDISVGGYLPVIEMLLVVVGGGLLMLLMMACVSGSLSSGGMLNNIGSGISKSFSASDHIDVGSFHKQGYINANLNKGAGVRLSQNVNQAVNQQF